MRTLLKNYRWLARYNWPHSLAVRPDVVNAKYHVITNATYNRDPVPAKFKHVTNIDTWRYYAVIIARCGKLCM